MTIPAPPSFGSADEWRQHLDALIALPRSPERDAAIAEAETEIRSLEKPQLRRPLSLAARWSLDAAMSRLQALTEQPPSRKRDAAIADVRAEIEALSSGV